MNQKIAALMKPYIICHMATSIDGRLHPSRFTALPSDDLRSVYERVHDSFDADGWIIGRKTASEMAKGKERPFGEAQAVPRSTHFGTRNDRKLAVIIDPHGRVHYGRDNIGGDHVVAVLGEGVSNAYLAELREDGVSYVFAGPDGRNLSLALDDVAKAFGATRLLLEGGGRINGSFFKQRLINEFSTLIFPAADGVAGSESIINYEGFEGDRPGAGQMLALSSCEVLEGGMVWLRHSVRQLDELDF